jgi:hypothetical protein
MAEVAIFVKLTMLAFEILIESNLTGGPVAAQ